ncbi:MAG: ABC-2 type transport system permease protein [Myxococcota bacterium]|jgi:ABC-2 type transport system permease protein
MSTQRPAATTPGSSALANILTLARRELGFYFNSPIAFITIPLFLVVCGVFLFTVDDPETKRSFFETNEASLRKLFEAIPVVFIFLVPAISMRLIAEEKRSGTIELLVTMPVTDTQIALGKFLGGLAFVAIALASTLPLVAIVGALGPLDIGVVIGGYFGMLLVGATYLAIGLMTSAWTSNQIVAYLVAAIICAFFYYVGGMLESVWAGAQDALAFLSFEAHAANLAKGVIDTRDVLFYLSFITVALVLTVQSLQARNWR